MQISDRNCEESQCYQRGTTVKEKETKLKKRHTHSSFDARLDPIQCAADVLKTNCNVGERRKSDKNAQRTIPGHLSTPSFVAKARKVGPTNFPLVSANLEHKRSCCILVVEWGNDATLTVFALQISSAISRVLTPQLANETEIRISMESVLTQRLTFS